ncbi:Permease of the drug/metabolite transporter (DMT) superfamily [Allopseudospirillum japonicum]|uniref:Permease of the drug/metabolite transporter (DMT) superfamily n=1 Tax=Allopseudospirillum japonicum TaxID=64971 RepID=A0A1H6QGA0_9GAMM|nr:DMT family transporter [Allopseudospirillum japonicum]SEI40896.1 Permease of the drug/metabolite transporter (DMT) superfamily [Allopseudospirillum japonicum]
MLSQRLQKYLPWVPWLFVLLWSTGFIGAKYALPYSQAFTFLSWRMLGNLAVFAGLIWYFNTHWPKDPKLWIQQGIAGLCIHGAYLGGVFSAIELGTPAGLTALLVGLQPLVTAICIALAYWRWPHPLQMLGLVLGFVGVALVLSGGQIQDLNLVQLQGDQFAWILLALLGISLGTLYQKYFCQPQPLLTASFIQYAATLSVFLPLAYFYEDTQVIWHPEFILALAWSVIVLSVGAILLLMLMIQAGEATKTASYFYLVPPLTALEAWYLFDEALALAGVFGMLLAILGVYLTNKATIK